MVMKVGSVSTGDCLGGRRLLRSIRSGGGLRRRPWRGAVHGGLRGMVKGTMTSSCNALPFPLLLLAAD